MRYVTAIIRSISLEKVVKGLKDIGVKGITISEVKGTGEEVTLYTPYSIHNKMEIIVNDHDVDQVISTILELAQTHERGDGVIAVQEIEKLVKIRTGEKAAPHDL